MFITVTGSNSQIWKTKKGNSITSVEQ